MMQFIQLGGYGVYVWPVYGAAILILGGQTLAAILRYRAASRRLAAAEQPR
jgi:heme exporter protein CcmD